MTHKRVRKGSKPDPIPAIIARFCLVRDGDKLVLELVQDFAGGCTRERYRQILAKMRRQYKQMQIMRAALQGIVDSQAPWEPQRVMALNALSGAEPETPND